MKYSRIIILLAIALIIGLVSNGWISGLADSYAVGDDARAMLQARDLPDSYLKSYTELGIPVTHSLGTFYSLISNYVDLVLATKLMSIFLYLLVTLFSYLLAKELKLKYSFLFSLLVTLQTGLMFWVFSGGQSRGFAFPLLLAFLYFFVKRNTVAYTIAMLLQALIYPPILLLSAGLLCAEFMNRKIEFTLLIPIIFPLGLLYFTLPKITEFGSQVNLMEAWNMVEFHTGGRAPIFRTDILHSIFNSYNFNVSSPLYLDAFFLLGIIALLVMILFWKKLSLPSELKSLIISSIIFFVLAFIFFSKLYLPSRYIVFTFPIIAVWYICKGLEISLRDKSRIIKSVILIAVILTTSIYYAPQIRNGLETCGDKELYAYLETLPKDSLIAAHPNTSNCIPLYSGRNVLFMDELSPPYYKTYYAKIKLQIREFFDMYYGNSKIEDFCSENGVSHIVIDKRHFSKNYVERGNFYREPINSAIEVKNSAILDITGADIGDFKVLECP